MAKIEDLEGKLKKLVPMLGSGNDGEVANAARLITKILRESKLDWHDVSKKLFSAVAQNSYYKPQYDQNHSGDYYADQQRKAQNAYWKNAQNAYRQQYNSSQQQNSYQKNYYDQQQKKKQEREVFWEERDNGNFVGDIFGRNCTVFRSKQNPNLWDAVINEFGGKTIWKRGYKTADIAKKAIEFALDPDASDEW